MTVVTQNPRPLWRADATGETARDAALSMKQRAPTLRQLVLDRIEKAQATGEQVYADLSASGVACVLYSIKPRLSELARMGLLTDSGLRGVSDSGRCKSIIWRATTPEEREAFRVAKEAEEAALADLKREVGQ